MDGSFVGSGQGSVNGTSGRRKRKNTEEIPEWVKVNFHGLMCLFKKSICMEFFYIKWLISKYLSPISRITEIYGKKNDILNSLFFIIINLINLLSKQLNIVKRLKGEKTSSLFYEFYIISLFTKSIIIGGEH